MRHTNKYRTLHLKSKPKLSVSNTLHKNRGGDYTRLGTLAFSRSTTSGGTSAETSPPS